MTLLPSAMTLRLQACADASNFVGIQVDLFSRVGCLGLPISPVKECVKHV